MLGMLQTMVQPDTVIHSLGPLIWIDSRYIRGGHGDLIVTATDKSGNGYDFVQGTSSKMPVMNQQIQKIPATMVFDGINDSMATSKTVTLNTRAITFALMQNVTGVNVGTVYEVSTDQNNFSNATLFSNNENATGRINWGGHVGSSRYNVKAISGSVSTWRTAISTYDRSATDSLDWPNVMKMFVTGTQFTNYTLDLSGSAVGAFGNYTHYLGARNNASTFYSGYISTICMFSRALTTNQIVALDNAIRDIHGRII